MPKFFVRQNQIDDQRITLFGDDAFHISRSLRMAKGEHITVCDMQRFEYDCVLEEFNRDNVVATIVSQRQADTEPNVKYRLFQALPKGDKLDTIIQKAVECGVHEIVPFESDRCVVKRKSDSEERKTERRNRISLEAAKQSGRAYVPIVHETVDFSEAIRSASESDLCLFCYEGEDGQTLRDVVEKAINEGENIGSVSLVIGSEGGFSTTEVNMAVEKGLISVGLGKRILRTETASSFVLSCLVYRFEL